MADINPESPEQAQAVQATPEAVTTPTATDEGTPFLDAVEQLTTARISGAGEDELTRLEALVKSSTPNNIPAEQVAVESNEEQQEQAVEETTTGEETEAETTETTGNEAPATDSKLDRIRLTHLDDADRALMQSANLLAKARGIGIKEAFAIVSGESTQAAQAEPEPEPTQETTEITQLQAELAEIEAKLDELAEAGELVNPENTKLTRQQSKLHAKIAALESRQDTVNSVNAQLTEGQVKAKRSESLETAVDKFPGLKDNKGEHWTLSRDLAMAAQNPNHPDHEHSTSLDAPDYFATKAAKILKIAAKGSQTKEETVSPSVPSTTTQQTRTVQPAPGSRQSAPPPPAKSIDDRVKESEARLNTILTGGSVPSQKTGFLLI